MSRWILFFLTLGLGAAAGLYFGWMVRPDPQSRPSLDTLREDFRTDYVLMIAETYQKEGDLNLATQQLTHLSNQPPSETIAKAILYAMQAPYSPADQAMMQKLQQDLQAKAPQPNPTGAGQKP